MRIKKDISLGKYWFIQFQILQTNITWISNTITELVRSLQNVMSMYSARKKIVVLQACSS